MNIDQTEKQLDQKLLFHYDQDFDQKYDKTQSLDREITSKDQLIDLNQNDYVYKNNIVFALVYLFYLLLWFVFVAFLSSARLVSTNTLYILAAIGIFFYLWIIIKELYWHRFIRGLRNVKAFTKASEKAAAKTFAKHALPPYLQPRVCPTRCKPKIGVLPLIQPQQTGAIRDVRTDSSLDDWVKGDQPEATWNMRKTQREKEENKPQPWYDGLDPKGATYYQCQWMGVDGNQPNECYSTIPCKYYPGYEMTEKTIGPPEKQMAPCERRQK